MLCLDDNCTILLVESVNELTTWMSQDNKTDPEILYWIPNYILMRGHKPLSMIGFMSPQFKALANSQDLIGWRDFTEGHIFSCFWKRNVGIREFSLMETKSRHMTTRVVYVIGYTKCTQTPKIIPYHYSYELPSR
jgi:hypothetical protein